jgi:hypothetical protein
MGDKVALGGRVIVGNGVKLSTAGWKGVGVALAFGSTVTRLKGGEEAGGFAFGRQATIVTPQRILSAQRLMNLRVLRALRGEKKVRINRSS